MMNFSIASKLLSDLKNSTWHFSGGARPTMALVAI